MKSLLANRLLFPEPPRDFSGRRAWKIVLRAFHVLFSGVVLGGYVLAPSSDQPQGWFAAALVSGIVLLAVDLHESAAFLLQVRGLVILIKVGLLAALPVLGSAAAWVLCGITLVSAVSSHAPSKFRYFLLVGRDRLTGGRSKG
jgi:hypothetical protein